MTRIVYVSAGGGYRGVISMQFWLRLEAWLEQQKWTRQGVPITRLHQIAALAVGTSTGALIMGGLAASVPMTEMNDLYLDKVKVAFTKNTLYWLTGKPKYDKRPLKNLFGTTVLKYGEDDIQKTKIPFMCATVNLRRPKSTAFHKSWKEKCKLLLTDAVEHSYSAAHYFGATISECDQAVYVDGGEGDANCALRYAIIEAYKFGWFRNGDRVHFIVVGTGTSNTDLSFEEAKKQTGRIDEVMAYMGMARDQAMTTQLYEALILEEVTNRIDVDYVDVTIQKEHDVLDGTQFAFEYANYGKRMATEYLPTITGKLVSEVVRDA